MHDVRTMSARCPLKRCSFFEKNGVSSEWKNCQIFYLYSVNGLRKLNIFQFNFVEKSNNMSIKQINSALLNSEELFRTTQNTTFGIFVVDALISACRGSRPEVKIDVEIEHQHLTVVLHNSCVISWGKGREVFCDGC